MPEVTLGTNVIVQGRHRLAGETVEVTDREAERFRSKGWIAKAKKHESTRAPGGPTPQAEAEAKQKAEAEAKQKDSKSKTKGKSSKG